MRNVAALITRAALWALAAGSLVGPVAGLAPRVPAADDATAATPEDSRDIVLNGRVYRVSAAMWRNLMPISSGDMQITVVVKALDGQPLNLTRVSASATQGRMTWRPRLTGSPTALELPPPDEMVVQARNGPRWRPGSFARVTLELTSGKRRVVTTLPPVYVQAAR